MILESIPIYGIARKLLQWLPGFLFRKIYSKQKLAQLIYIDLQPRCESARINLGEAASASLVLQVINLSPYLVELDRGNLKLNYAGGMVEFSSLQRIKINPGIIESIHLESVIADGHANQMARNAEGNSAWLSGNFDFNCKVHSFAKSINSLQGIQVILLNSNFRMQRAKLFH